MKKTDARILRSRRLLREALINLAVEKPYEDITVRELVTNAQVGYATFFRHYQGKDDLLFTILDEIIVEVSDLMLSEGVDNPYKTGLLIFQQVQKKNELYRVLLSGSTRGPVLSRVKNAISEHFIHNYRGKLNVDIPIEVAANHVALSTIALIQWWLDNGLSYTSEKMASIYVALIVAPVHLKLDSS